MTKRSTTASRASALSALTIREDSENPENAEGGEESHTRMSLACVRSEANTVRNEEWMDDDYDEE